jgi:glutathione synthase/RimK-type ligase-like ATP-grasp enzyme
MILQEYVPKRLELRVTVVGERVFACQIDSQASRATRHDYRHHDNDRAALSTHALPDEMAARCARMVAEYGLCYGALDLVLTPSGEYVFLELNPMGEWAWIQVETGLPIADAIVDVLTAPVESRQ